MDFNHELTERYARWLKMTEVVTTIQQENQDSVRYEYNTTVEGRRVQSTVM